jgi:Polypeptide deformylase
MAAPRLLSILSASAPDVFAKVEGSECATMRYQDLDGGRRVLSASGMLAVCIQHEFEHARGEPGRASARPQAASTGWMATNARFPPWADIRRVRYRALRQR